MGNTNLTVRQSVAVSSKVSLYISCIVLVCDNTVSVSVDLLVIGQGFVIAQEC